MSKEVHPFIILRQTIRQAGTQFRRNNDNSRSIFNPSHGFVYAYDLSMVEQALGNYEATLPSEFQEQYSTLTIEEKLVKEAQLISSNNPNMDVRDFARTVAAYLVINADPMKRKNPLRMLSTIENDEDHH
jgi:hypothetical protein